MVANSNVPIHARLWCVYEAGMCGGVNVKSTMWLEWNPWVCLIFPKKKQKDLLV